MDWALMLCGAALIWYCPDSPLFMLGAILFISGFIRGALRGAL